MKDVMITDNYRLKSDTHNIVVEERRIVDPTKSPNWAKKKEEGADPSPQERWIEISYHQDISTAIKSIFRREVRKSPAESVAQLIEEIRSLEKKIDSQFSHEISV